MSTIKEKLVKGAKNPWLLYSYATAMGLTKAIPDKSHLRILYRASVGKWPDLDNPHTFNEKLQWLKLHDRNPLYTTLVDKYRVKRWVAERIGEKYVVPTYGAWEHVEDIDLNELPDRFVLKTNHDCGGIAICRDRATFDFDVAKRKLAKHLKKNYYWGCREWPYKDVKPLVFAEEYLEPDAAVGETVDYKLMCFGGKARCVFTCTGRAAGDLRVDFFDLDWNHLPFERHYPNAGVEPSAPSCFREMREAAERLSEGIPFVRVDFYDVGGEPRFGEMTFYPGAGFEEFAPEEWDGRLGEWVRLPESVGGGVLLGDGWLVWAHEERPAAARGDLPAGMVDYKFYCFGGEPRLLYVSKGLEDHATARISFLTLDWEFAPFGRPDYRPFEELPPRPACLAEMVEMARELSAGIPFVRVDLYEHKGSPLFSEMTFSPCAGLMEFDPPEWDGRLGEWVEPPRS